MKSIFIGVDPMHRQENVKFIDVKQGDIFISLQINPNEINDNIINIDRFSLYLNSNNSSSNIHDVLLKINKYKSTEKSELYILISESFDLGERVFKLYKFEINLKNELFRRVFKLDQEVNIFTDRHYAIRINGFNDISDVLATFISDRLCDTRYICKEPTRFKDTISETIYQYIDYMICDIYQYPGYYNEKSKYIIKSGLDKDFIILPLSDEDIENLYDNFIKL